MGTGSFPGVKRPVRGVEHPSPYSAEVKERVELYLYSPSGSSWPVIGRTLPLSYLHLSVVSYDFSTLNYISILLFYQKGNRDIIVAAAGARIPVEVGD